MDRTVQPGVLATHLGSDPSSDDYRHLVESITGVPGTDGNRVDVLRNGDQIFPAMLAAIRGAERTIDFMTYVYWTGAITETFAQALAERAHAGVRVRVLLDGFGSRTMDAAQLDQLRDAGAEVVRFRPLSWKLWRLNMRTHRRVLVCDEAVAFTGGVGISQEWAGNAQGPDEWRDTHFRLEGPAVDGIHAAFYQDWLETEHAPFDRTDRFPLRDSVGTSAVQVLRAASQPGWNEMALALWALLSMARRRIRVTSAYFRPHQHFVRLLCDAADRGVDVDVVVPGPYAEPRIAQWAGQYQYERFLDHGVRLWRYQPTMHHGKIVTVDGAAAVVGTTNFDARSLALNEQVGLILHDPAVVAVLDEHFEDDQANSLRLEDSDWEDRALTQRALEHAAHWATFKVRGGGATRD